MSDLIEQLKELTGRLERLPSGVGLGLRDRQLLNEVGAHICELEAKQSGLMKCVIELKAERAALESATIERCIQTYHRWNYGAHPLTFPDILRALKPSDSAHLRSPDALHWACVEESFAQAILDNLDALVDSTTQAEG